METEVVEQEEDVLACVAGADVAEVFTQEGGVLAILAAMEQAVGLHVPDLSTGVGRAAIARNANKIRTAKVYLNGKGKDLVAAKRAEVAEIDGACKRLRDGCDLIHAEARKPLTEWEVAERDRVEAERLEAEALVAATRLAEDHEDALILNENYDLRRRIAAQEAEDRMRQAKAEEDAREERERQELEEQEHQAAAARAEAAIQAAKDAAAKAEQDRLDAIRRAEQDRIDADLRARENIRLEQERAQRSQEAAVAAERARIEREQKAKEEAEKRQAADRENRDRCEMAAVDGILLAGISEQDASVIVQLIADGRVPHVRIDYTDGE